MVQAFFQRNSVSAIPSYFRSFIHAPHILIPNYLKVFTYKGGKAEFLKETGQKQITE